MLKKITENIIETIKEPIKESINKTINSGATLLDLVLGGGYGIGKVVNIVGDKSSGKTLLAIEFIATAKKLLKDKLKIFYDDCESGFSFDEQELYGFKIIEENQKNSETIEEMKFNLEKKLDELKSDEYLIYVVDSLDGLSCEAEKEREDEETKAREKGKIYDKGSYKLEKTRYLKYLFRMMAHKIKDRNCLLIIISQVIMNIGVMFGEKYSRTGGKALDHYSCHCIWLSEVEKMKKKDLQIGMRIKIKCAKNKIIPQLRSCFIDILHIYGIDNITSNINYLYDLLTPQGKYSAKKIEWDNKEYTPIALVKYIEENNLESELENKVKEKWQEIEKSISTYDRKYKW